MTTTIKNVTISEKAHNGEARLGRPTMHHICDGIYEVIARCRVEWEGGDSGQCFRSYGLFASLDDIPNWVWNAR